MSGEIVIGMPTEKAIEEATESVTEQAATIVETAAVIAEMVADAADDSGEVFEVISRLDNLTNQVAIIVGAVANMEQLLTVLPALIANVGAPVIVESTEEPEAVPEVPDTTVIVGDDNVTVEEVPEAEAITPQIKKQKSRKWV